MLIDRAYAAHNLLRQPPMLLWRSCDAGACIRLNANAGDAHRPNANAGDAPASPASSAPALHQRPLPHHRRRQGSADAFKFADAGDAETTPNANAGDGGARLVRSAVLARCARLVHLGCAGTAPAPDALRATPSRKRVTPTPTLTPTPTTAAPVAQTQCLRPRRPRRCRAGSSGMDVGSVASAVTMTAPAPVER